MKEVFLDIPNYEGLYQISNLGNVKNIRTGKLLKNFGVGEGYRGVELYNINHDGKKFYLHRLVAQSFLSNPNNYPQINHKDKDRTNNSVDNLEWCTALYNVEYSHNLSIIQFNRHGDFICEWSSIKKASDELRIDPSDICNVCRGRKKSAGGYIFKYKN